MSKRLTFRHFADREHWIAVVALLYLTTATLSVIAASVDYFPADIEAARAVQRVEFPAVWQLERAGYALGSFIGIVGPGLIVAAAFALARRYSSSSLILAVMAIRGSNQYIKEVIASPRPPDNLIRVAENATGDPGSFGFPSGHAMGSVLLYGAVIYLARLHIRSNWLRTAIQAAAVLVIAVVGWSRIYSGGHWPSDVVGGALWGASLLLPLIALEKFWRDRASHP